jgi:hypothetical protein
VDTLPSLWLQSVILTPFVAYHLARWRVITAFRAQWARAGGHGTKRIELGATFQDPLPEVLPDLPSLL